MIRTENITRSYKEVEVLKGIDMEVGKGEVISIVGASGAGKTTMLQILGTLDHPSSGQLYFNNEPIGKPDNRKVIHANWSERLIGYIIDRAVIAGIELGILYGLWQSITPPFLSDEPFLFTLLFSIGFGSLIAFSYYFLFEALTNKTLGKYVMRTRVIDRYGKKPKTGAIVVRTLGRLIPFEAFSFISRVPQNGLHDGISNTIVIKESKRKKSGNYSYAELGEDGLARFRNEELGFVFQFHHLLPEFTALENVCIPGYISGQSKKKVESRARELLDFLGLGHRLEHKPFQLSGGEQQRVAVARALINNPTIVLADEPSGNLDSTSAKELHQLFFDLRDKYNQTFVIVTHNNELAEMADRKLVIKDGVIVSGNGANTPKAAPVV